jgi:putative aldouronate transport system substrate-binding protein
MKKTVAVLLSVMMVMTMLAGCSTKKNDSENTSGNKTADVTKEATENATDSNTTEKPKDPYEITFLYPGEAANDMDVVLNEFYARTKDTLNVKLSFLYAGWDDIGQKVSLKISAGEKLDSAFLAQWTAPTIQKSALDNQILNLDKYFNNDQYPGLKAAFSEEYLSTNKFLGPDGEYHVYGIPFSNSYSVGNYLFYRKDLADKYGITIKSPEDLEAYYDAILKNEKGMTPLAFLGSQDQLKKAFYDNNALTKHNSTDQGIATGKVIIKDDGTAYVSRSYLPELDPEFVKYMDPNDKSKSDPYWEYEIAARFYQKGYVSKDVLNTTDAQADFMAGRAASVMRGSDVFNAIATQFKESLPNAELGYLPVNSFVANDIKHQTGVTFQAWNFATIPVTCEDPDRVMEFYDWIFQSQENHDLFELGVEGKHWKAVDGDKYEVMTNPDTGNTYNFTGYLMTWNPTMLKVSASIPEDVNEYNSKFNDPEYLYKLITAGFSFNSDPVKTEVALISDVISIKSALGNGMIADYKSEIAKLDKQLEKAGWEKYAEEYEKQLNEYLKTHPYEGQ